MFQTNQANLCKRLEKENRSNGISQESKKFQSGIWDHLVMRNNKTQWLKKLEAWPRLAKKEESKSL